MSTYNTENFPSHISPKLRIANPSDDCIPTIQCPPDPSRQFIILNDSEFQVIKGYETKSVLDMSDFFVPCNSYQQIEILIPDLSDNYSYEGEIYHDSELEYSTIDYGFMKNQSGRVSFIAIFPMYHQTEIDDQNLWILKFRFQGEEDWRDLGRCFIWSSTSDNGILPIEIKNTMGIEIFCKILIVN